MKDYTGKTVCVGIDVHKKTYAVTCVCEGENVKHDTLVARPARLEEYLRKFFPDAHLKTAYEAGFSGFVLHRYLEERGIESMVVHAANVEISARDVVKTDKRDSLKLAMQLLRGQLEGIYVPSPEREVYREVSRLRGKVAKDKKRAGNRLKSILYRQGLIEPEDDSKVSPPWLKKVSGYDCNPSIRYCIEVCAEEWLYLEGKIKNIDAALAEQALKDAALEKVYRSAPGIGPVHARVLANELEDMKHFPNAGQMFSYIGLTPSEHSSGERKRQGHITRQGRPLLRKTLILVAWKAIEIDAILQATFSRIAKHAGNKRAIVGVARKLIGHMRSCFKSNTLYKSGKVKTILESVRKEVKFH